MRRRLLTLLLLLIGSLLIALMVPLAQSYAEKRSQDLYVTRVADTARFAVVSEQALRANRLTRLRAEIVSYDQLYDVGVAIVDTDGDLIANSRPGLRVDDPSLAAGLEAALAGRTGEIPATAWPWVDSPYVIAEPIGRDSQVLGAVITVSPTTAVQADISARLLLLAAIALAVLAAVAFAIAVPLVRWLLRPIHDLDGAAHEITVGHFDARVSERDGPPELRGLATSFNAMADSVTASLDQQRAFVADASHQLRNPLTALRLRVENLDPHVDDDGRAELHWALDESDRMAAMLDSLLALAREEATRAERIRVDVAEATRTRVEALRPLFAGTELTVEADQPAVVLARPDVIDQVLDALLDNAAKFASGAPVEVCVSQLDGEVTLRVRDHGPGIPEPDLDRLGERFYRSRIHQNLAGSGLGLAITRNLVEGSGGTIEVAAGDPSGLDITVRLPAAGQSLTSR